MKHTIYKNLSNLKRLLQIISNEKKDAALLLECIDKIKNSYTNRDFINMALDLRKLAEGGAKLLLENYYQEKGRSKEVSMEGLNTALGEFKKSLMDEDKANTIEILRKYFHAAGSHCNKAAHHGIKKYDETEIVLIINTIEFIFISITKWFNISIIQEISESTQKYKTLGNIFTKMIPIFPYRKNYEIFSEHIKFKYDVNNIFTTELYESEYNTIDKYINSKDTVYNEAKPSLIDFDIKRNEEEGISYIELVLGINGYHDFLTINRNLDFLDGGQLRLKISNSSLHDLMKMNIPKSLGVSSILVTNDRHIFLQKRNKSEVASNMNHVSIAEGLCVHKSYNEFVKKTPNKRGQFIKDNNIKEALLRGIEEEIGVIATDISDLEILSIYFDEELMQPIFQTTAYVNKRKNEIEEYIKSARGIDTVGEIKELIFCKNNEDDILKKFKESLNEGYVWSTHAVINLISYLEYIGGNDNLIEHVNNYFEEETLFSLGKQNFIETLQQDK